MRHLQSRRTVSAFVRPHTLGGMAVDLARHAFETLPELRVAETTKRVRATVDGRAVVDSRRAMLVWEPHRVVPLYAVPADDIDAELVPAEPAEPPVNDPYVQMPNGTRILPPGRFGLHTTDGQSLSLRAGGDERHGVAYRLADSDLPGYVVLDFDAFDEWLEEEEQIVGHPRDPFKRIDVRRRLRHVLVEIDGVVVAESTRPRLLFETHLPVRMYLPPDDVRLDLLAHSDSRSVCAYKGEAAYWSIERAGAATDVAWSYPHPFSDAVEVGDMICFFDEHVDVTVDGEPRQRPRTPWS